MYRRDPGTYLAVLHPRVDGVVCVSHAVEKYVKKRIWKRTVDNVVTIYKGHDLSWYTNPEADLTAFGTGKDNFNVACVANARIHKGLIYVVKAANELYWGTKIELPGVMDMITIEEVCEKIDIAIRSD